MMTPLSYFTVIGLRYISADCEGHFVEFILRLLLTLLTRKLFKCEEFSHICPEIFNSFFLTLTPLFKLFRFKLVPLDLLRDLDANMI